MSMSLGKPGKRLRTQVGSAPPDDAEISAGSRSAAAAGAGGRTFLFVRNVLGEVNASPVRKVKPDESGERSMFVKNVLVMKDDLPEGWENHFDPNWEDWYIWNKDLGMASWWPPSPDGTVIPPSPHLVAAYHQTTGGAPSSPVVVIDLTSDHADETRVGDDQPEQSDPSLPLGTAGDAIEQRGCSGSQAEHKNKKMKIPYSHVPNRCDHHCSVPNRTAQAILAKFCGLKSQRCLSVIRAKAANKGTCAWPAFTNAHAVLAISCGLNWSARHSTPFASSMNISWADLSTVANAHAMLAISCVWKGTSTGGAADRGP